VSRTPLQKPHPEPLYCSSPIFIHPSEKHRERKRERGLTVVAAAKEKASCRISLTSFSRAYQYGFASSSSYEDGTAVAGLSPALLKLFCLQIATSAIQKERVLVNFRIMLDSNS